MARKPAVDAMAFTADEVHALTGLSLDQLDRWKVDLYAPQWPSGLYSFVDLVALRVLAKLRNDFTVPRQQLTRAGRYLRSQFEQPWSGLRLGVGPKKRVYFWDPINKSWLSADNAQQKIAAIALDEIRGQLEKDVRKARQRDPKTIGTMQQSRGICGNQLRIAGTRITVEVVKELIEEGLSDQQIRREFPSLKLEDIKAVRENLAAA